MLARSTLNVVNSVYQASVAVELDSVDSKYIDAYGEPRIDTAGAIPFTSALQLPATTLAFDTAVDLGSVPVAGSAVAAPSVGPAGYTLNGSGTFTGTTVTANPGFFRGKLEVIGDFDIRVHLLDAPGAPAPLAVDGFGIGLAVLDSLLPGDPAVLLTWGAHHGTPRISHRARTVAAGAAAEVAGVAQAAIAGVYLRLASVSGTITAYYSLDNMVTWTALGTSTMPHSARSVGVFINSGSGSALSSLVDNAVLQSLPSSAISFTIAGSPNLRYIRSQSPHLFQLDGKVDPDAQAKVKGWVTTTISRMSAAKAALYTNTDPTTTSADGTEKLVPL